MRVVDGGRLEDLERLIQTPSTHLDDQNNAGQTALMVACRRGRFDFAKALLQAGANANLRQSKHGASAAWILVERTGNEDMLAALVKDFGADATIVDGAGRTLLHEAASRGRKRLVEWLALTPEVDVLAKDAAGKTALEEAKTSNNTRPEVVTCLKERMRKRRQEERMKQEEKMKQEEMRTATTMTTTILTTKAITTATALRKRRSKSDS